MKIYSITKPKYNGDRSRHNSRYDYFLDYMTNIHIENNFIYKDSFNSVISDYLKRAGASRQDLSLLEFENRSEIRKLQKKTYSATGLVAKSDAQEYVEDAFLYSKTMMLREIKASLKSEGGSK